MPDLVVVDTDVLIDAARNVNEAVTCLEQVELLRRYRLSHGLLNC